jgi:hypothetical protein
MMQTIALYQLTSVVLADDSCCTSSVLHQRRFELSSACSADVPELLRASVVC